MTDAEWAACGDPRPMLSAMCGQLTDGTLRRFAIACVRRVWHLLRDERARRAVEAAEAFVAGRITADELAAAKATITSIPAPRTREPGEHGAFGGAWYASGWYAWYAAWYGSRSVAQAVGEVARAAALPDQEPDFPAERLAAGAAFARARDAELVAQAALLRELVGPRGSPPAAEPGAPADPRRMS
jgi:hypothetical protein